MFFYASWFHLFQCFWRTPLEIWFYWHFFVFKCFTVCTNFNNLLLKIIGVFYICNVSVLFDTMRNKITSNQIHQFYFHYNLNISIGSCISNVYIFYPSMNIILAANPNLCALLSKWLSLFVSLPWEAWWCSQKGIAIWCTKAELSGNIFFAAASLSLPETLFHACVIFNYKKKKKRHQLNKENVMSVN